MDSEKNGARAIAAIMVSMVLRENPLAQASRKIAAALRYVEKPIGSSISHCERGCSVSSTSRRRSCTISETMMFAFGVLALTLAPSTPKAEPVKRLDYWKS